MTEATDDQEKLRPIAALCTGEVSFRQDGWRNLILMQGLRFVAAGDVHHQMDAVLCLNHENPSYPTKLYLAQQVGSGLNWNETAVLLGRQWHTFSWSNVSPNQSWFDILAVHLGAITRGGRS